MSEVTTTPIVKNTSDKPINLRQCEIVTDVDKLNVDLQKTFMEYSSIKQWAYIIHDKDDTRPHYHIYLYFDCPIDMRKVAKWFDIPLNFIQKIKGRKCDYLLYLIHANESQKNKYQYDHSEVHANFDWEFELEQDKILGDFEKYTYAQQLEYVNNLPVSEKVTAFTKLKKLWELQCNTLTMNVDRNIEVMFITGVGGTGKTYYAKKLLRSLGYDFCLSSSSNDVFQDYLGQQAIVLDDIRDSTFSKFEELLKLLDNDTNSSVKGRFHNKVFVGKMIIITSSVPLYRWYKGKDDKGNYFNLSNEDFQQLYRRISSYVEVTSTEITVYTSLDKVGKPIGKCVKYKNELQDLKKEKKEKLDVISIFDKICEKTGTDYEINIEEVKQDSLPF